MLIEMPKTKQPSNWLFLSMVSKNILGDHRPFTAGVKSKQSRDVGFDEVMAES
jgi:hypothetical protein